MRAIRGSGVGFQAINISGIHDMGGAPGYGRVEPEPDEPVFHREWEGRVFGLVVAVKDGLSRPRLESLDPDEYLSGYYQRWLLAFERGLLARGAVSAEELDAKTEHFRSNPAAGPTRIVDPELTRHVRQGMYRQRDTRKTPPRPPAFGVGDRVRARSIRHGGHTRSPGYAQGKRGVIHTIYAAYDLPDDHRENDAAPAQHLYSVRFEGTELWGASAEPGTAVHIDMWEGYLEPLESSSAERSDA